MPARHVVVDGSNIATEGNSLPSLKQLDEAVREFLSENPDDVVTVVVDATFGHRIPAEERKQFEEAELDGDLVSPPAGAIGRGDAFLLRVADKVGAVVLSNDSFQEFHGEYEWLFDKGRLIGGKPVPGVGWIFTPRSPVRGPKSRESVKEAKRKRRADAPAAPEESGLEMVAERQRAHSGERKLQRAIAVAVEEAVAPEVQARRRRRRRRGSEAPAEPLNEPFSFISFIAAHQLGSEVEGTVEEFSSHGAFVAVEGARCYVPLSGMGDVAPRSAREALRKGETRAFVVQAFDAMRRGIELALPGFARPAGAPTPETIEAEIHRSEEGDETAAMEAPPRPRRARRVAKAETPGEDKPAAELVAVAAGNRAERVRRARAPRKAAPPQELATLSGPVLAEGPVAGAGPGRSRRAAALKEPAPPAKPVAPPRATAPKRAGGAEAVPPKQVPGAKQARGATRAPASGAPAHTVVAGKRAVPVKQAGPAKQAVLVKEGVLPKAAPVTKQTGSGRSAKRAAGKAPDQPNAMIAPRAPSEAPDTVHSRAGVKGSPSVAATGPTVARATKSPTQSSTKAAPGRTAPAKTAAAKTAATKTAATKTAATKTAATKTAATKTAATVGNRTAATRATALGKGEPAKAQGPAQAAPGRTAAKAPARGPAVAKAAPAGSAAATRATPAQLTMPATKTPAKAGPARAVPTARAAGTSHAARPQVAAKSRPVQVPAKAASAKATPAKAASAKAASTKVGPAKAASTKAASAKAASTKAASTKAASTKAASTKAGAVPAAAKAVPAQGTRGRQSPAKVTAAVSARAQKEPASRRAAATKALRS